MTLALNAQREICVVQKMGGLPIDGEVVLGILQDAVGKVREVVDVVERRVKEDWEGRRVEVR